MKVCSYCLFLIVYIQHTLTIIQLTDMRIIGFTFLKPILIWLLIP